MSHLWYMCFQYGDLCDLNLTGSWPWPEHSIKCYLSQFLPLWFRSIWSKFCPKLIILRSLRPVTWNPRFWPLTWPWPDTWPNLKNRGWFRIVSSRVFERSVVRFSATICSRVMRWGRLTRALEGGLRITPSRRCDSQTWRGSVWRGSISINPQNGGEIDMLPPMGSISIWGDRRSSPPSISAPMRANATSCGVI